MGCHTGTAPGIIGRMTDGARTSMEGSPACPFIAYEGERDERSTEPDHEHRCYAEVRPAARALAHQEAYCLSSAFPVCPTFQAWARREAAQARSAAGGSDAVGPAAVVDSSEAADLGPEPGPPEPDPDGDELVQPALTADDPPASRNPHRDWAAPPPWAGGTGGAMGAAGVTASRAASSGDPPDFLASRSPEGQGLAGSAADRLAGGSPPADTRETVSPVPSDAPSAPADPELAGLVGGAWWSSGAGLGPPPIPPTRPTNRPAISSTRDRNSDRSSDRNAAVTPVQAGPAWEKARRYEAYPTIKTRTGMPDIPRVVLLAGALGIAALALFFLPAILGLGGKDTGGPAASSSASVAVESASPSPTIAAAPTPQVYIVKSGDNLTKIAKKFGLTVEQLKAANPGIKNINKIALGAELVIPVPPADVVTDPSGSPSANPSP